MYSRSWNTQNQVFRRSEWIATIFAYVCSKRSRSARVERSLICGESTDGADINSHVQQCAALLDNNDASRQVDRNIVIPDGIRVRLQDYRDRVVHRTNVRLRERCLLSTRERGLRRPVTRCELWRLKRFFARVDSSHVARRSLDGRQFQRQNTSLRRRPQQTRCVSTTERAGRRRRIERHFSLCLEIYRDVSRHSVRRGAGHARLVGNTSTRARRDERGSRTTRRLW